MEILPKNQGRISRHTRTCTQTTWEDPQSRNLTNPLLEETPLVQKKMQYLDFKNTLYHLSLSQENYECSLKELDEVLSYSGQILYSKCEQ